MAETSAGKGGLFTRLWRVVLDHIPTRESIEANRFLRPFAHRILAPELWRFTRRSVPRGVALGLFTGVLFPFVHAPVAAGMALPVRANVPVAVVTTVLHNPLTTVPLYWSAYHIGLWVLHFDRAVPSRPIASSVKANVGWLHWLVAQGGPALIIGLIVLAVGLAIVGYFVGGFVWRLRMARKWRNRGRKIGPKRAV